MAVRIAGITLPQNKRIEIALTYIYGIGATRSKKLLELAKMDPNRRTDSITDAEANNLREIIENNYKVEGELKRSVLMNIKRLKEINTYRGNRHTHNLPTRGQRTKTNSRTAHGNVRRTMGSGRKSAADKT